MHMVSREQSKDNNKMIMSTKRREQSFDLVTSKHFIYSEKATKS